jgi:hypothetical protein
MNSRRFTAQCLPVLPTGRIAHPNRAGDLLRRGISVPSMSGSGHERTSDAVLRMCLFLHKLPC